MTKGRGILKKSYWICYMHQLFLTGLRLCAVCRWDHKWSENYL